MKLDGTEVRKPRKDTRRKTSKKDPRIRMPSSSLPVIPGRSTGFAAAAEEVVAAASDSEPQLAARSERVYRDEALHGYTPAPDERHRCRACRYRVGANS